MNSIDELSIYNAIRLLTGNAKLTQKDKILGIYEVDTRLKVKVYKTTIMGNRKEMR